MGFDQGVDVGAGSALSDLKAKDAVEIVNRISDEWMPYGAYGEVAAAVTEICKRPENALLPLEGAFKAVTAAKRH